MIKTLKDYAKHFDTCPRLGKARSHPAICTCGLDALVSGEGESRREQEQSAKDNTSDLVYSSELGYVLKAEAAVETVDQLRAAVIELSNRHIPQHRIKEALDRLILAAEARGRQQR